MWGPPSRRAPAPPAGRARLGAPAGGLARRLARPRPGPALLCSGGLLAAAGGLHLGRPAARRARATCACRPLLGSLNLVAVLSAFGVSPRRGLGERGPPRSAAHDRSLLLGCAAGRARCSALRLSGRLRFRSPWPHRPQPPLPSRARPAPSARASSPSRLRRLWPSGCGSARGPTSAAPTSCGRPLRRARAASGCFPSALIPRTTESSPHDETIRRSGVASLLASAASRCSSRLDAWRALRVAGAVARLRRRRDARTSLAKLARSWPRAALQSSSWPPRARAHEDRELGLQRSAAAPRAIPTRRPSASRPASARSRCRRRRRAGARVQELWVWPSSARPPGRRRAFAPSPLPAAAPPQTTEAPAVARARPRARPRSRRPRAEEDRS